MPRIISETNLFYTSKTFLPYYTNYLLKQILGLGYVLYFTYSVNLEANFWISSRSDDETYSIKSLSRRSP